MGRTRRAAVWGVITVVAVALTAYVPYLQIYANITSGGDTARELTDTAIAANKALFLAWRSWQPWSLGVLAACNLGCALDLGLRR
jgi:hypothetical protein